MSKVRALVSLVSCLLVGSMIMLGCGGGNGTTPTPPGPQLVNLNNFQQAAVVIGQPDFTSNAINNGGAGANTSNAPDGVADGSLFIAQLFNNRVLGFNTTPNANFSNANFVLGQPDFVTTNAVGAPTATKFHGPSDVAVSGGKLFVVSFFQSRLLIWNTVPAGGAPADLVAGQPNLTTGGQNTTQTGLDLPEGLAVAGGKIVVGDTGNNRVMIWNSIPAADNAPADVVLGQAAFNTAAAGVSQTALDAPNGVWTDGTRLVVCDSDNNRVLIWTTFPVANNQPANLVLGQATFATNANGAGPSGMNNPSAVACNGTQLFIADSSNHRVLVWNTFPTTNGQAAEGVLGQSNFTNMAPNDDDQNGAADASPTARTLNSPQGLTVSGNQLFVCDTTNNRTLIFNGN